MSTAVLNQTLEEKISNISDFLEELEAHTTDKQTAKSIQKYMTENNLWKIPTPPQHIPKDPEVDQQIAYNAVKCLVCNETIVSRSVHDYKTCGCENEAMVDGGNEYARYGAVDMSKITKITYTTDDPFDLLREFVSWGSYGKDGNQPLKYIKLKDMTDEHLRAVIVYPRGAKWIKDLMKQEIDYREEFNISITE